MPSIEAAKPNIRIFFTAEASDAALAQLQYGIEEEGIPWQADVQSECSAVALAWDAAQTSRLDIGIGLDADFVVLHYAKLDSEHPLFRVPVKSGDEYVRTVGANAARLVKKLPLKSQDRR